MRHDIKILTEVGALPISSIDKEKILNLDGQAVEAEVVLSDKEHRLIKIEFHNNQVAYYGENQVVKTVKNSNPFYPKRDKKVKDLKFREWMALPILKYPINNPYSTSGAKKGEYEAKSDLTAIHENLWKSNHSYIEGFFSSIMEAYGHILLRPPRITDCYIKFTTHHHNVLEEAQRLLSLYGIKSTLIPYKNKFKTLYMNGYLAYKFVTLFDTHSPRIKVKADELKRIAKTDTSKRWGATKKHDKRFLSVKKIDLTDNYERIYNVNIDFYQSEVGIIGGVNE